MRKRSDKEKEAMGLVDPIFQDLLLKHSTRGYMPILDIVIYAYANKEKEFNWIMKYLKGANYYVGVSETPEVETEATLKTLVYRLNPSMVRTIETALEHSKNLQRYGLEKLKVILDEDNDPDAIDKETKLLNEIGEQYGEYDTHEERVIVFFTKKILRYLESEDKS